MTCDIVAEAGVNHNGSGARALAMVKAATEAGCNGFKLQCYDAAEFVGPKETYTYLERDGKGGFRRVTERQRDMFDRCALKWDDVRAVHSECARVHMTFVATATDQGWIDLLKTLTPAPIIKVGSDDLIHRPLLRAVAASGLPSILSTGMASVEEITAALEIVRPIVLLHCVSLYPTPIPKANLLRMEKLAKLGIPVGYSDHTEGSLCATLAAAMGAKMVEKHFTLDKTLPGPDHWFSADAAEMKQLVAAVRVAVNVRGSGEVEPTDAEKEMRRVARRSAVAACDVPAGTALRESMVAYWRPGTGVPPGDEDRWIGHVTARKLAAGDVLEPSSFMPGGEVAH